MGIAHTQQVSVVCCCSALPLQEASGVLAEVAELTSQNQGLNKTFMALAGATAQQRAGIYVCTAIACMLCAGMYACTAFKCMYPLQTLLQLYAPNEAVAGGPSWSTALLAAHWCGSL